MTLAKRCFSCGFDRPKPTPPNCYNCGRSWSEPATDTEFWNLLLDDAPWLFYGDLDEHFGTFVKRVFDGLETTAGGMASFGRFGFKSDPNSFVPLEPTFAVAYWLFLSSLVALDFAEYGTSPRGAWLTKDGERFRRIFTERYEAGTLEWHRDDLSEDPTHAE